MSELLQLQMKHFELIIKLGEWLITNGYRATWGETKRTQAQADANAASGAGIANSLHLVSLAADLNLFKNGVFITTVEGYQPAGEYWKSLDPLCCWGGDFKKSNGLPKPDADHFSITYGGIK